MKKRRNILLLLVVLVCSGCASIGQFTSFPDQRVNVENPSKARIYVMRPAVFMGAAIAMSVKDGDQIIGVTKGGNYLCWERNPGDVVLTSKSENEVTLRFHVDEGKSYYILQRVEIGLITSRTKLELIGEVEGKKDLSQCSALRVLRNNNKAGYEMFPAL